MNVTEDTSDALILGVNSSVESRILDFGASFHYTSHHEIMENYFSDDFNKVHMADDETLKIMGKGDIQVKLPNETVWKLKDVRFIPSLKRNLISIGQLDQDGYCTTFTGSEWKITKEAMVIAHGKKNGTLYVTFSLEIIIVIEKLDEKLKIWHQRLSHMSELERDEGSCFKEEVARSKISRLQSMRGLYFWENESGQFLKIDNPPKIEKLKLVHTNMWVPSPMSSIGGSLYYVTFIDDSTRKVRVYFLKKK